MVEDWVLAARKQWTHTGATRPDFAIEPGPGQESVWDYPRPPAVASDPRRIEVIGRNGLIASTDTSIRIMETSLPPSFYLPPESIVDGALVVVGGGSFCEWKGEAEYLAEFGHSQPIAWRYPQPYEEFSRYAGWVSFYPALVECRVEGEVVRAQNSSFYGGWITDDVVGPFKGDAGLYGV